jgi:hypothetical protein
MNFGSAAPTPPTTRYPRKMGFFEKLIAGWWWIGKIVGEWAWTMTHDDHWEFFDYLQTDYVKYEETTHYEN